VRFVEARVSCELLLEQRNFERAVQLLEQALPSVRTEDEWRQALGLVERVPEAHRIASIEAAAVYARVLNKNQRFAEVLEFSTRVTERHGRVRAASVQLECGWGLIATHRHLEARNVLEEALLYLHGEQSGMAFRCLGLARFGLGESWREAFGRARALLSGDQLGRAMLDEGYCLTQSGQNVEARTVWLEALPLFRSHPRMLAWVRYNLGISAMRDLDPEAERHFLEAERLTRKPQAATLRVPTLNGMAGARRMHGEWSRAEFAYRAGLEAARDAHDREESYFGLERTYFLAHRYTEALETLEFALSEPELDHNMFHIARAKNHLALGQPTKAAASLSRVGTLVSEYDKWLEGIAKAELARQEGRLDEAANLLKGLPVTTLHAREEVRQWPELFALAGAAGLPVPQPLEYADGLTVRVTARGVLHVAVNGRPVPILPTGRAGELLVFLLEHDGEATLDTILDAFYPQAADASNRARARKMVWEHAKAVRELLGWQNAVVNLGGAYQLDPSARWQYDIREARASGVFRGEFLSGVYSDWALEVGRELSDLKEDSGTFLN
jgi:tetratricopeptide (TPR) repeat protein